MEKGENVSKLLPLKVEDLFWRRIKWDKLFNAVSDDKVPSREFWHGYTEVANAVLKCSLFEDTKENRRDFLSVFVPYFDGRNDFNSGSNHLSEVAEIPEGVAGIVKLMMPMAPDEKIESIGNRFGILHLIAAKRREIVRLETEKFKYGKPTSVFEIFSKLVPVADVVKKQAYPILKGDRRKLAESMLDSFMMWATQKPQTPITE